MLIDRIARLFGSEAESAEVLDLFQELGTFNRPELSDEGSPYFDWVLVRRKGVELGFADAPYFNDGNRSTWRTGPLVLVQCYLYRGHGDVQQFCGELPRGMSWGERRDSVLAKWTDLEGTRHSSRSDCWDMNGMRLTASYSEEDQTLERIFLRRLPVPLSSASSLGEVSIAGSMANLLGGPLDALLSGIGLAQADVDVATEGGGLDLRREMGLSATFVDGQGEILIRSLIFHRDRDMDACQWQGSLPNGLAFEDSPERLLMKVEGPPAEEESSALSGSATWHFADYTLHVLYSKVDNRLVRISMHAPGVWRKIRA